MAGSAGAVTALLRARGSTGTYRQTTGGTYDPGTRSYSGGTTQTVSVWMAAVPFEERDIEDANVARGDLQGIVSAEALASAGVTPGPGDQIDSAGTRYRVTPLETVRLSGEPVAYLMQLRAIS